MKKQPPRARSASRSAARHQFDHVVPTVIHDPEEKMTALGRWTHRFLKDPQKAATWATLIVAGLLLGVVAWNLVGSRTHTSDLWNELDNAKKPEDRVTLAKENPASPAASWGLLQAATEFYNQALADMPNNRDVAGPMFKRALDLFDQVARAAPKDSAQARVATLGKARSLEARNELSKAIEQYRLVAQTWPSTSEGAEAARLADALEKPDAATFYKELYAFSPTKVTLPPLGSEALSFPPGGPAASKPPTLGTSSILPEMPFELTSPEVREVKKSETKTQGKGDAKAASTPVKSTTNMSNDATEKAKPVVEVPATKPVVEVPAPKPHTKPSAPRPK
jgi:hypothetical protein